MPAGFQHFIKAYWQLKIVYRRRVPVHCFVLLVLLSLTTSRRCRPFNAATEVRRVRMRDSDRRHVQRFSLP